MILKFWLYVQSNTSTWKNSTKSSFFNSKLQKCCKWMEIGPLSHTFAQTVAAEAYTNNYSISQYTYICVLMMEKRSNSNFVGSILRTGKFFYSKSEISSPIHKTLHFYIYSFIWGHFQSPNFRVLQSRTRTINSPFIVHQTLPTSVDEFFQIRNFLYKFVVANIVVEKVRWKINHSYCRKNSKYWINWINNWENYSLV